MDQNVIFVKEKDSVKKKEIAPEDSIVASDTDDNLSLFESPVLDLLKYYKKVSKYEKKEVVSPIHVDELASKFAHLYEKVRRVIDWKEEHLIRRTAIDRSLKRRMLTSLSGVGLVANISGDKMAKPLVMELIRGGYFPNDKISGDRISHVKSILNKYIFILENSSVIKSLSPLVLKKKMEFYNWILEIAACEVEEALVPPLKVNGVMNFMTNMMNSHVNVVPEGTIKDQDKVVQMYVAVHRTLYNLDDPIIIYNLLEYRYPLWATDPGSIIQEFTRDIFKIWRSLDDDLSHKHGPEFYKICEKYDAVYLIIGDVLDKLSEDPDTLIDTFSDREELGKVIKEVYDKRVKTLKSRLSRSAVYSTLSIFLAGGVSLFIFEVPLAKVFYGHFSIVAMFIDLMIPTIMMFVLVSMIKPVSKKNYDRLLEQIEKVVYKKQNLDVYEIQLDKKKKFVRTFVFGLVYLFTTVVSFGLVFWVFYVAHIPWTSLYIDTANIAVVVFAALVIRQRSKEVMIDDNVGFGDFLIDIFSIPLAKLGQWLASKWKEYNVLSVFFTVVVDFPVLTFVEIIEDWSTFLKDKKAGIH